MNEQIYYGSIDHFLNEELSKRTKKIEEKKATLEKAKMLEKMRINSDLKDLREKNVIIGEVQKLLSDFRHIDLEKEYSIPDEIIESIEMVASRLETGEAIKIQTDLNAIINKENYHTKKEDLEKSYKKLQEIIKKAGISSKRIPLLFNGDGQYTGEKSIEEIIKELNEQKTKKLQKEMGDIRLETFEDVDKSESYKYVEIDEIIKKNDFSDNSKMAKIKSNYESIKKQMIIKEKALKLIESIDTALQKINHEQQKSKVDYSKVISKLNLYKENAKKQIVEADKYLSKFDIKELEKEIERHTEENKEKKDKEGYKKLVYEMEKAKSEGDLSKAESIKKQMAAYGEEYSETDKFKLQQDAKEELWSDQYNEEISKESKPLTAEGVSQKTIKESEKEITTAQERLREIAIEKLKASGIPLDNEDRENLIINEIAEMQRTAKLSPQERRIEAGNKNPNDDIYYTDSMMDFDVKEVKEATKELEKQKKVQANTVYKEYLKYYARMENKEDAMKFSEFAAMKYGYTDVNEQLVDDDLKEEMTR